MHHNQYIIIKWLLDVMVFPTNNIRYQQVIFIFDQMKSIQLLNYIYHYVNQNIHCVDNENYVIHIIYEYDFIMHYYLTMILFMKIILVSLPIFSFRHKRHQELI